jgi:hypothetical protein
MIIKINQKSQTGILLFYCLPFMNYSYFGFKWNLNKMVNLFEHKTNTVKYV